MRAATFESIDCRLDVLIAAIGQAQGLKKLQSPLSKGVMRAKKQKQDAERLAGLGHARPAKSALEHAVPDDDLRRLSAPLAQGSEDDSAAVDADRLRPVGGVRRHR